MNTGQTSCRRQDHHQASHIPNPWSRVLASSSRRLKFSSCQLRSFCFPFFKYLSILFLNLILFYHAPLELVPNKLIAIAPTIPSLIVHLRVLLPSMPQYYRLLFL